MGSLTVSIDWQDDGATLVSAYAAPADALRRLDRALSAGTEIQCTRIYGATPPYAVDNLPDLVACADNRAHSG